GGFNTYTGGTTVNAGGTLKLLAGGTGVGTIRGILNINSGGTVIVGAHDTFGYNSAAVALDVININKGGVLDNQSPTANNETMGGTTINLTGGTWQATGTGDYFQLFSNGFGNAAVNSLASDTTATISTRLDLRQ